MVIFKFQPRIPRLLKDYKISFKSRLFEHKITHFNARVIIGLMQSPKTESIYKNIKLEIKSDTKSR